MAAGRKNRTTNETARAPAACRKRRPAVGGKWIDVSLPLKAGMARWPGDPPFSMVRVHSIARGDQNTLSRISMSAHAGTHVDAPLHFIAGGPGIDAVPLETVIGPARVIPIKDRTSVRPEELERHAIARGERILFKTANSKRRHAAGAFVRDFVYVSREAAEYLVLRGVRLVGTDYLSVEGYRKDGGAHRILLARGIWVVEGLDLSAVVPGSYDLVCLPLKIPCADGAPARAALKLR